MCATVMYGAGYVRIENGPDATVVEPTDAVVRVTRASICGSDLWPYKTMDHGDTGRVMGHEAIGIVEAPGSQIRTLKVGDLVVMPFAFSDDTCVFCHEGLQTSCVHGGFFGTTEVDGAQAEAVRVPQADGTLFVLPVGEDDELMPSLLTLSDVMGTGHHAAVAAKVGAGKSVAVVGDGAVGLCGVIGCSHPRVHSRSPDALLLAARTRNHGKVAARPVARPPPPRVWPGGRSDCDTMQEVGSTRVSRRVKAPRARVYDALLDANAIVKWKVPSGMTSHVHEFERREGGTFRISLTYDTPTGVGKTTARTDTYHGRFVKLVPNELVVEVDEFETADPAMRGEMTITIALSDADGRHRCARCARGATARRVCRRQRGRLEIGTRTARRTRRGRLERRRGFARVWLPQATPTSVRLTSRSCRGPLQMAVRPTGLAVR